MKSTLKERLRRGEPVVGLLNPFAATDLAELLALSGFDFIMFDMEHGNVGLAQLPDLFRATRAGGAVPLVRVPDHSPKTILRALEAGAAGTMAPQVESAEQALALARAHRYPPAGSRGYATGTPAGRWGSRPAAEHVAEANDQVLCIVQVESIAGLEEAAAIAATPGVDVVLAGPGDLSGSLGLLGAVSHPEVQAALDRIFAACRGSGAAAGMYAGAEQGAALRERGVQFFLSGVPGAIRGAFSTQRQQWARALGRAT